jgi:hypothetical protein
MKKIKTVAGNRASIWIDGPFEAITFHACINGAFVKCDDEADCIRVIEDFIGGVEPATTVKKITPKKKKLTADATITVDTDDSSLVDERVIDGGTIKVFSRK